MGNGKLRKKTAQALALPNDMMGGVSSIIVTGGSEILLYCCENVISYSEEEIALKMCDMILFICGTSLTLRSYNSDEMMISGTIEEIKFLPGGGR